MGLCLAATNSKPLVGRRLGNVGHITSFSEVGDAKSTETKRGRSTSRLKESPHFHVILAETVTSLFSVNAVSGIGNVLALCLFPK